MSNHLNLQKKIMAVFAGSWRKINPILLIVLSAAAGILIYYVF